MTKEIRETYLWAWSMLGSLVSAVAVISIIQHIGDIQLRELPAQYLEYYRQLISDLTGWIPLPFGWEIAQWYGDLMSIAAILTLTYTRTFLLSPVEITHDQTEPTEDERPNPVLRGLVFFAWFLLKLLLAPITIIQILVEIFLTYILSRETLLDLLWQFGTSNKVLESMFEWIEPQKRWLKTFGMSMIVIMVTTVSFFVVSTDFGPD